MKKVDAIEKYNGAKAKDKALSVQLEDYTLPEKTNWTEVSDNSVFDEIDYKKEYLKLKQKNEILKKKVEILEKHILTK